MLELKNLAKYQRYLLEDAGLLIIQGSIAPVIAGMQDYNSRHRIAQPDKKLDPVVQELLAAAALTAVSLSERESWGWSLTFKGMDAGFFVGVEPEGMICARILESDREKSSGMIQRQKAGLPMTQSHIRPRTQSPRDAVEQYFSEVDQTRTRLVIKDNGEGILAHSLPGGAFDTVQGLETEELFAYVASAIAAGRARGIGEVLMFYECRCSEKMISRMIANMNESDRRDMFGEMQQVEIECPRCGRKYPVSRTIESIH